MKNIEKEITEFLNISKEVLVSVRAETVVKMVKAVEEDDFFELHQLGYEVKMEGR